MTHTDSGKRKVWRTDAKATYCCCFEPSFFVWEKGTQHNNYQPYSGYVDPRAVVFIDMPPKELAIQGGIFYKSQMDVYANNDIMYVSKRTDGAEYVEWDRITKPLPKRPKQESE
jgi:hypothetical protein